MSQGLCPSCGAAVNLTAGQNETKCQYCDTIVTLKQAEAHLTEIKNSKIGGNLMLAETYFASREFQKALNFYDKALEQDGMAAEAWLGRGHCLLNINKDKSKAPPRIDTTGTFSSLEAAIRFAANPQLMAKRGAKVIAEVVSRGLRDEEVVYQGEYNGWGGVCYRTADYNALLGWAIERDDRSELLIKTGAEFYSRCRPHVDAHRVTNPPVGQFKESIEKFYVTVNQNDDRFLKLLQQIDPAAANKYQETFRKAQSVASVQIKANIEAQEEHERSMRRLHEDIDRLDKKSGCFVATACYGDYEHPVVMELRHFRDDCLETSILGRAFVKWYYHWSPPFASFIDKNSVLKNLARVLIVNPAVTIARFFTKTPQ